MTIPVGPLYSFFLLFIRILAFLGAAPLFSQRTIPNQVKIGLAAALAFLLAPLASDLYLPQSEAAFLVVLGQEILLGLLMGFAAMLPIIAISLVGRLAASAMGLSYATSVSPLLPESAPPLGQFYLQLGVLLFLAIRADHVMLLGLKRMVEILPPGQLISEVLDGSGAILVERMIALTGRLWIVSLQIALPVIGVILLADLALVMIGRAMPRMNIFAQSMPLKVIMGLLTIFLSLPFFWQQAIQELDRAGYQMLLLFR